MSKERVFNVISQVMNVPLEEVNEHSSADTIETWDSLQHMNLILGLEDEFKIKFTDEEIMRMVNAQEILTTVISKSR